MANPDDESLLEFPTDFPVKAMGRNASGFRELVVGLVSEHTASEDISEVREQASKNGRFLSVTVTFVARDREQIDAVYMTLHGHEQVMLVL